MRAVTLKQLDGFSAVELLITLFVAAIFLAAGYQLFNFVVTDSGNTRAESSVSNSAYDYLRRYSNSATNPCAASTVLSDQALTIDGVDTPTVTVTLSCPQTDTPSLTKVEVAITYGTGTTINTVKHATFVDKSKGATP